METTLPGPKGKLLAALLKAKAELAPVIKGKDNPHYHSAYAGLDDLYKAIDEPLRNNELVIIHQPVFDSENEGWVLRSRLYHSSGEFIDALLPLDPHKTEQQLGSSLTYFRRYNIGCLLSLSETKDDDGNATKAQAPNKPTVAKAKPKPKPKANGSKAGDGTPAQSNTLASIWPAVWDAGNAMGLESKEATTDWFREILQEWMGVQSTKDLNQTQANQLLIKLRKVIADNTPPDGD